ncbi:NAD(P)-dependent oxidoreductase [Rhizobium sp. FY34]|uniref:NAD(P)-dependent oxidoreductase n=1 Tax=Rhizobium sp. FY34 TaxID=2562309 RepID=UPI0010C0BCA5|nr:NAD(P)-dependent oxidoreductase [Rhizobium sp. FY34]
MEVAFVGLGQMGRPMAVNLSKTTDLIVFDANQDSKRGFGRVAADLSDLAAADLILLSLPRAEIIDSVLFQSGLADRLKPGTIIIDTGTTDVSETLRFARKLSEAGLRFLDAPVSGMQSRAEDGTLTMMVGGDSTLLKSLEPYLSTMANSILHMGPEGAGQTAKLINQLLFDINAAAIAEIGPLAVLMGLNPTAISDVINSGTGRSFASEFFLPRILEADFSQGYPLAAAYKDIASGLRLCAERQIPAPVLYAASATYQQALREGHGSKDKGAMILVFENLLNVKFRADKVEVQ